MRVGLVGCVKSKRPTPSRAQDLYTSPLFEGSRRAVERSCHRWFILSAHHGLLSPGAVIEPYEDTLTTSGRDRRRHWSAQVLRSLRSELGSLSGITFEVHAGSAYYAFGLQSGLEAAGATVEIPTAGLTLGQRLAFYALPAGGTVPASPASSARTPLGTVAAPAKTQPSVAAAATGKYLPLYDHLTGLPNERWEATFSQIESLLGVPLPPSARAHPAWWANERNGAHSHARAWLGAGFVTRQLRLCAEQVTFVRHRR